MSGKRKSDRERAGLHGPVKTCAENWSTTEFAEDGRILLWHGNTFGGSSERRYSYDEAGRLLSIQGSAGDHTDNFHYDGNGRKILVRTIPARPGLKQVGISINVVLSATEEGDCLAEGGTVVTTFNDWDEPTESEVRDAEDHPRARIIHEYDSEGRLIKERLIQECSEFAFPGAFRDQIPLEHRETAFAQLREKLKECGFLNNVEQSYIYDGQGRLAERQLRAGSYVQTSCFSFKESSDTAVMIWKASGGPLECLEQGEQHLEIESRSVCVYDQHGNWTEQTTSSRTNRDEPFKNSATVQRRLTYY